MKIHIIQRISSRPPFFLLPHLEKSLKLSNASYSFMPHF